MSVFNLILVGCGGQAARTVDRYMPGDEKKSCATLLAEIVMLDDEMVKKEQKRKDRDFWNTAEFVGGCFVIVPFFFMDSKGSHEIEYEALQSRKKMLKILFAEKGCSVAEPSVTPVAKETAKTISQKEYEKYQQYLAEQEKNKLKESATEKE